MAYKEYLQRMLSPLGVYDLSEESISGASVAALGEVLDDVWNSLQNTLRDAFPQTAGEEAISLWEQIAPTHPRPAILAGRQEALTYLLSRKGVGCAAADAEQALAVCGVDAEVDETANTPRITFRLSTQGLSLEEKAHFQVFVRKLVPAHLQITVEET